MINKNQIGIITALQGQLSVGKGLGKLKCCTARNVLLMDGWENLKKEFLAFQAEAAGRGVLGLECLWTKFPKC